jgi:hypothetical protein
MTLWGIDFLGAGKYPKKAVRYLPRGFAFGCFTNPESAEGTPMFGNGLKVVKLVALSDKAPLIRCQILWSDKHVFGDQHIPIIRQQSRAIEAIAKAHPLIKFEISPFCEHNLSNPDKYLDIVKAEAPSCKPVNVPYKGAISQKYKNEVHGSHSAPKGKYNYSWDGSSIFDSDVEGLKAKHKGAEVTFLWFPQCNGRKSKTDPTPRPDRGAWPTPEITDSAVFLTTKKGKASLPAKWLWKSHADQHYDIPEPRANKPVLLCPGRPNLVELIDAKMKVVAVGAFAGIFDGDKRAMFRFPEFGYKTLVEVLEYQKASVLRLRVDRKIIGRVNAAFRQNEYRL